MDDSCEHIMLDSCRDACLMLWKVQSRSVLIVVVNRMIDYSKYKDIFRDHLMLITQGMHAIDCCIVHQSDFTRHSAVVMLYSSLPFLTR